MAIANSDYKETDGKYQRGVALDTYGDKFSMVSAGRGKDGNIYATWIYHQKRVNDSWEANEKSSPLKVELGETPEQALDTLRFIAEKIKELKAPVQQYQAPQDSAPVQPDDSEIPF